eukprot:Lithocolla_globosa_v1_NODE_10966_length_547_cov_1264.239837.p1 type:complete len:139 gc:universal NODE_10966_length_547_cov_1264.239837:442-26(-)
MPRQYVLYGGSNMDIQAVNILPPIAKKLRVTKKSLKLICIDPLDRNKGSGYFTDQNVNLYLRSKYVDFYQMPVEEYKRPSTSCIHLIKGTTIGLSLIKPGEHVFIDSKTNLDVINKSIRDNYPHLKELTEDEIINITY